VEPQPPTGKQKSYLLQKVQALLPYLAEILRQNDDRSNGVVGKLSNLRDNLDLIFEDMEKEVTLSGEENEELRQRLRAAEQNSRVVEVKRENAEARRRLEAEIEQLKRENGNTEQSEEALRIELKRLEDENRKAQMIFEGMKKESDAL
jgi:chromosome segregation ATPase